MSPKAITIAPRGEQAMRVLVTGGRDFCDRMFLFDALAKLHSERVITAIIHGGASGADQLAGEWAKSVGIQVEVFPADWKKHGKAAGPIRNAAMLKATPDIVVAFPGGRGTANMILQASSAGVHVLHAEKLQQKGESL